MNFPNYIIRRAVMSDAQQIADFNTQIAWETESIRLKPAVILSGVTTLLQNESKGFYIVVEVAGNLGGALMVTTEWSDWRNGEFWWIQSVYVVARYREKGIYSALYRWVKEQAEKELNVCGFRLYVEKENMVAQKAYHKAGMTETHYKLYEELKTDANFMLC